MLCSTTSRCVGARAQGLTSFQVSDACVGPRMDGHESSVIVERVCRC